MKLGFIGAGNMATGLARGWARAAGEPGAPGEMVFADASPDRAEQLASEVGGEALGSNQAVAEAADLVLLAVKPNVLDDVAGDLVDAGTPVVSILAGTPVQRLSEALPGLEIVRVMPNLGAQLRQGVFCVAFPDGLPRERRDEANALLGLLGDVIELDEDLIDAATALMGCTPGYLALMAEVLVEEGVRAGLGEDESLRMVARSMAATGGLLDEHQPVALKQAVASPGGMTEAGLDALEERQFREALRAAVEASLERARSLS
jgi:pyrroline-5-carboxylate reductase